MAEAITIARPYAEAAFGLASQAGTVAVWGDMLDTMAQVSANTDVKACIGNPDLTHAQLAALFLSLCGKVGDEGRNFVAVLAENRRLAFLPQIRELFESFRREREGTLDARILSAFPISDAQKASLVAGLEKKFGRRIQASVELDPELIGGVEVIVGDQVIDGSVRARLAAMAAALTS